MKDAELNILEQTLKTVVGQIIRTDPESIIKSVDKLRKKHPDLSRAELAKKFCTSKAILSGLLGGATSFVTTLGNVFALPAGISADIVATWKIQAIESYAVAYIYGFSLEPEKMEYHTFFIMAGDAAKEELKKYTVSVAEKAAEKATEKAIQKAGEKMIQATIKTLTPKLVNKIAINATAKTVTKLVKFIPFIGVPIGFTFDLVYTKAFGKAAVAYYQKLGDEWR